MTCWDRCATDEYDSVIRRLESAENKNLDQDNAIGLIRDTMPNASVVDTLTIDVDALQDEKLDNEYMDEDIHFGPITITKDGTAVIASLDAVNPITGVVTPLSFTLPGATSTDAGVMDASSVAWITEAEARISALEGLSDVKALVGLSATPTQAEINTAWMEEVGKAPETGDLVQDVSNAKLWVYVTDTWILYGSLVVVPLATTTSLGGVKDTALNAPSNRWYSHVEADGRLSLIGGDSLSTLLDTTVPGIQSGVNNSVKKTGNENIGGIKVFTDTIRQQKASANIITFQRTDKSGKEGEITGIADMVSLIGNDGNNRDIGSFRLGNNIDFSYVIMAVKRIMADDSVVEANIRLRVFSNGSTVALGITPPANASSIEIPTAEWTISKLASKQNKLTFDNAPTTGSTNPVTSGGVYTALDAKQDSFSLYEHTIRVWTTAAPDKYRFSLTALNQSSTAFTLPTLHSYLGGSADDYKQCSGVALIGTDLIDLTGVRGGTPTQLYFEGVNESTGAITNVYLDWMSVEVLIADKVKQIV